MSHPIIFLLSVTWHGTSNHCGFEWSSFKLDFDGAPAIYIYIYIYIYYCNILIITPIKIMNVYIESIFHRYMYIQLMIYTLSTTMSGDDKIYCFVSPRNSLIYTTFLEFFAKPLLCEEHIYFFSYKCQQNRPICQCKVGVL